MASNINEKLGSSNQTITINLAVGDVIVIQEFNDTVGNYVPNTPTKMGLYPSFRPEIYVDNTYLNPTTVIRGHDGSITVAFEDVRDDILLEFETRIYNNLKVQSESPIKVTDIIPGQFRTTEYTLAEVNEILSASFLSWVATNKIDYAAQYYVANNPYTYNYSQSSNKLTGNPLLGAWRGIYEYFYDTYNPAAAPWVQRPRRAPTRYVAVDHPRVGADTCRMTFLGWEFQPK